MDITIGGRKVEVELTAKEVAEALWALGDDEQADMFHELYRMAGEFPLSIQFLGCRDQCIKRQKKDSTHAGLLGFQTVFAAAFRHAKLTEWE